MIDGDLELPETMTWFDGYFQCAKNGGFFRPAVKLGDKVTKGAIIGTTINYFGDVVDQLEAPYDGIVATLRDVPSVYSWRMGLLDRKNQ